MRSLVALAIAAVLVGAFTTTAYGCACCSDWIGGRVLLTDGFASGNPVFDELLRTSFSGTIGRNRTTFNFDAQQDHPSYSFAATFAGDRMVIVIGDSDRVIGKGEFIFDSTYQHLKEDAFNFVPAVNRISQAAGNVSIYHEMRFRGELRLDSMLTEVIGTPVGGEASLVIYGIQYECFYPNSATGFWFDFAVGSYSQPVLAKGTLRYEP